MSSPPDTTTSKSPVPGWISTRHLQHIVARGEAAGISVDTLLAEVGLAKSALVDADAPVPLAAVETMLASLSQRYSDPLLGLHLASDIQPATFGAIGYISQACTNLSDVVDVAVRYSGLLSNIGKITVVQRPGLVDIQWQCLAGGPVFRRHATEYVIGAFVVLARLLVPEKTDLVQSVAFTHSRPADTERAREYFSFFRSPVHFDRPVSSVTIPVAMMNSRLRHGDAFIKDMLERHAQNLLRQREQKSNLRDDVKRLVEAMTLDGLPGKDAIAQQLAMSSRSLHRKLQENGTSYREILDDVRLGMARRRLVEGDAINAVALDLGFSTHQAFLRWFRNNTGTTPGEFRRLQTSEGAS